MQWLTHLVLDWVGRQMETARMQYGVNPLVFLIIFFGASPVFYYSIFRMVRALATKRVNEAALWSMVFLASTAAPYLYVLVAGHNLPWWVYIIIGLILAQGVWSLVRRLRKKPQPDRR